jgi:hypothetical protein
MGTTLYKTTGPNGEPIHLGSGIWPLPQNGEPGEWREETGPIEKCRRGLHLTDDPAQWWKPGCRIWVADAEGVVGSCGDDDDRKIVCRRARLVREVTDAGELASLRVYVSGSHEAKAGRVIASGSATVRAYDSATVRAYDSATVEAYGSATVRAYDSATVEAYGSATVRAYGSATVRAYDSATVEAYGSATVRATDAVTVVSWWGKPGVRLDRRAIWIDRSADPAPPTVRMAETQTTAA